MNIEIENVGKVYSKGIVALRSIDLDIHAGIYGLLGPNGAGKTTLMRILATLITPTSGTARVGGYRVDDNREKWEIKARLGYLPQELTLYGDLSAHEFLNFVAAIKEVEPRHRREQIAQVLDVTGLADVAKRRLKTYSGGMKRRVGIAQALIGTPSLLIVDEPTVGLDPQERVRFRNLLVDLAHDRTVLLSTHIIEDVAQTCSRLGVLQAGRLVFNGAVDDLTACAHGKTWEIDVPGYRPGPDALLVASVQLQQTVRYRVLAEQQPHPDARLVDPSLEDGYLWQTQPAVTGTGKE